jgi:hypothetical protein
MTMPGRALLSRSRVTACGYHSPLGHIQAAVDTDMVAMNELRFSKFTRSVADLLGWLKGNPRKTGSMDDFLIASSHTPGRAWLELLFAHSCRRNCRRWKRRTSLLGIKLSKPAFISMSVDSNYFGNCCFSSIEHAISIFETDHLPAFISWSKALAFTKFQQLLIMGKLLAHFCSRWKTLGKFTKKRSNKILRVHKIHWYSVD